MTAIQKLMLGATDPLIADKQLNDGRRVKAQEAEIERFRELQQMLTAFKDGSAERKDVLRCVSLIVKTAKHSAYMTGIRKENKQYGRKGGV